MRHNNGIASDSNNLVIHLKSLGWNKGKQDVRFEILTSQYDFAGKSILDIGCGFGDINLMLNAHYGTNYTYHGIDLVEDLVTEGRNPDLPRHILRLR
jgi:ubiquinone/menaquinone biosynthesis C-methylase UbiE